MKKFETVGRSWAGLAGITLVLASWAGTLGASAGTAVLQSSVSLARLQNTGSAFEANDFHIRFKADRQWFSNPVVPTWLPMVATDLNSMGFYFSCGGITTPTSVTVTESNGWIDIEWTFPTVWIDANGWDMFGFTNLGGVRFNEMQWWWTKDGVDVRQLPEVWQDWFYEGGVLVDRIRNSSDAAVPVNRTVGQRPTTVEIGELATMITPPNPIPILPPVNLNPGQIIDATWPWPTLDPSYYMFYEFPDATNNIRFTNAANVVPVPEAASAALAATGLALCCLRRRRFR